MVLQPKNKKKELIKFHHKDYIFKPKEIINSLLSEKKFNYFIYGLFRSEILKKSYLKFDVKSSDRYFLLQFPLANYNFGYLENCIYFRGIHEISASQRYKKDNYRILIEKENFILKPIPALLRCKENLLKQQICSLKNIKIFQILTKVYFFNFKRQVRLILRFSINLY